MSNIAKSRYAKKLNKCHLNVKIIVKNIYNQFWKGEYYLEYDIFFVKCFWQFFFIVYTM